MADIINFGGRKNKNWLNQFAATGGQVPSAAIIDQMIQSELDAAYKNRYYSGALQLEQNKQEADKDYKNKTLEQTAARDAADAAYKQRTLDLQQQRDAGTISSDQWRKEQGALQLQNQKEAADAARSAGLVQAGTGLATTALGLWGKDSKTTDPQTGLVTEKPGVLKSLWNEYGPGSGDRKDATYENMRQQDSDWVGQQYGAMKNEQQARDTADYQKTIEDYLSDANVDYENTVDNYLSGWSGADMGGY